MRNLVLILLFPLALSAQVKTAGRPGNPQSAPPAPPPTPAADLATMEGTVFNAIAGTPLRKATISINRQNGGPMAAGARSNYSATTDATGHYSIAGIEPGTYRLPEHGVQCPPPRRSRHGPRSGPRAEDDRGGFPPHSPRRGLRQNYR